MNDIRISAQEMRETQEEMRKVGYSCDVNNQITIINNKLLAIAATELYKNYINTSFKFDKVLQSTKEALSKAGYIYSIREDDNGDEFLIVSWSQYSK